MRNVASLFTEAEIDFIRENVQLSLSDDIDYTEDQLLDIHQKLLDYLPCDFDSDGDPLPTAVLFESIIDKFYTNLDI